jgi:hypothetical protein
MKWLAYVLLAVEVALAFCVIFEGMASNAVILLLACNSVLLLWTATRLRRKPACCR